MTAQNALMVAVVRDLAIIVGIVVWIVDTL